MDNTGLGNRLLAQWKRIAGTIALIGIGSFFLYSGVADAWDEYTLMHKGDTTAGLIVDAWEDAEEADSGGLVWYHTATYTYQLPDGRDFEGRLHGEGRLKPEFRYLSQPYPIEVTYLPDDPTVSRITKDLPNSILGLLRKQAFPNGFCSVLFFALGFYLLWGLVGEVRHSSEDTWPL